VAGIPRQIRLRAAAYQIAVELDLQWGGDQLLTLRETELDRLMIQRSKKVRARECFQRWYCNGSAL